MYFDIVRMTTNTVDREKNIEALISKDFSYFQFYIGSQITSIYATKCLFFEKAMFVVGLMKEVNAQND